jgi:hypothetical protein
MAHVSRHLRGSALPVGGGREGRGGAMIFLMDQHTRWKMSRQLGNFGLDGCLASIQMAWSSMLLAQQAKGRVATCVKSRSLYEDGSME